MGDRVKRRFRTWMTDPKYSDERGGRRRRLHSRAEIKCSCHFRVTGVCVMDLWSCKIFCEVSNRLIRFTLVNWNFTSIWYHCCHLKFSLSWSNNVAHREFMSFFFLFYRLIDWLLGINGSKNRVSRYLSKYFNTIVTFNVI